MTNFLVVELPNAMLGLTHGVYRQDGTARMPIALCYTAADATMIADSLSARQSVAAEHVRPAVPKSAATKKATPARGRKPAKKR